MYFRSVFVAGFLMATTATSAFADEAQCKSFLTDQIGKVTSIFHNKSLNEMGKRKQLAGIFREAVDTDWIGRAALGRYWKQLSAEEQQSYLSLYGKYLSSTYISKFDEEDGMNVDDIKLVSFTPVNSGYEAKTVIQNKQDADVKVDYVLDDTAGACKVHDVKVEGVSLLISQRSEFGTIASQGGPTKIISLMQQQLKQ